MKLSFIFNHFTCPAILRPCLTSPVHKRFAVPILLLSLLTAGLSSAAAEDLNILVIGSTRSYSVGQFDTIWSTESGTVQEHAFNPSGIASQLQSILAQDPAITGSTNVVFEDIYKTKTHNVRYSGSATFSITNRCLSLAQHYMWPEGKAARLANLRGQGDHQWDYIVLFFDPYILGNFPGMVAEGVKMIQDEVAKSDHPAQILLFAQWPWEDSIFSVDDYNEVMQRVGSSAGLPVVAAGKAWESYTAKDSVSGTRPTPKGAYLGAAAIYSTIFERSAKTSTYTFASDGDNIADHALAEVQANALISHYSGKYEGINPFQMKYVRKRVVSFRHTGTSTERGIRDGLTRVGDRQRVQLTQSSYRGTTGERWDFNYGRGNDLFEDSKQYEVDPGKYDRSYGFPMHHYYMDSAPLTMPYGIDKQYLNDYGGMYDDGTDLGIAYNMIRPGTSQLSLPEDVRAVPIRLMWTKMAEISPGFHPLRDRTHMNRRLDDATAAFMYTLLSGRCPVVPEPANTGSDDWLRWLGNKIGYETAWRMAHLTTRVPGFRVLPSATSATTVTPGPGGTTETMTVQFMHPPQENVIVNVSISSPSAAIVGTRTLVFTPDNHAVPQQVTVAGLPGASSSEFFEVVLSTSSADEVFDGLGDAWAYTNTRAATQRLTLVEVADRYELLDVDSSLLIDLEVSGSAADNTTLARPSSGTLTWTGADVLYTPAPGFFGTDGFAFAVNSGGTLTTGHVELTVQELPNLVIEHTNGPTTVTEGGDSDTYTVVLNRAPGEAVTVSLTVDDQVTVTPTSLTFAASDWDVPQVVTVTAVDDDIHEQIHTGTITHTTSSLDPEWDGLSRDFVVTIIDNDNTAPEVDAGPDRTLALSGGDPWIPTDLSPAAWYDASDASTLTLGRSGNVTQWDDKSGNARNATQPAVDLRPSYNIEQKNGLPTISFPSGTARRLDVASFGSGTHNWFFAAHREGTGDTSILGANNNTYLPIASSGNTGTNILRVNGSNDPSGSEHRFNGESEQSVSNRGDVFDQLSAADGMIYALTGVPVITDTSFQIGMGGNDSWTWQGELYEILCVEGTISDNDRQKMEGYLAHKWGLAAKLPADHPYKSAAPTTASATAILAASASDADGDPLVTTWSVVSGPGTVLFEDTTAINTTATFSDPGTYVLRLTAFDGQDTALDEVTITIAGTAQQTYSDWISGFDLGGQAAFNDDYNNDGVSNGMKYFFGIDPTVPSPGLSVLAPDVSDGSHFSFTHPMAEYLTTGVSAEYRWTKDLSTFHTDGASDEDGTTVTFDRGEPVEGMVPVTATISGTPTDRIFVTLVVTQDE